MSQAGASEDSRGQSLASVDDVANFEEFCRMGTENEPEVMAERHMYLAQRYDFTGVVGCLKYRGCNPTLDPSRRETFR